MSVSWRRCPSFAVSPQFIVAVKATATMACHTGSARLLLAALLLVACMAPACAVERMFGPPEFPESAGAASAADAAAAAAAVLRPVVPKNIQLVQQGPGK